MLERLRWKPSWEFGLVWSAVRSPFGHGGEDSEAEMIVEVSEGDGSDMGRSIEEGGRRRRKVTVEREKKERERERRERSLLIW